MSNIAQSSSSQQGLPVIQTPFGAIQLTPEQVAAMFQQMQMQQQKQMQQMQQQKQMQQQMPQPTQKHQHASRVLNAPKRPGRSGLPQARTERLPAPAGDEVMRPFAFACHQLFARLVRAADGAFYNIPADADSNRVMGVHLDNVFRCKGPENKESVISVADALYGFRVKGGHFTERRTTHRAYHITNPFEAAQIYALSKGYYLCNMSDPSKGLGLHLMVFRADPKQKAPLWHGQNIQPAKVDLKVDLSSGFEDVTQFYMKPIRDAARFVNASFAADEASDEASDEVSVEASVETSVKSDHATSQ
jgi:hypothetical protein